MIIMEGLLLVPPERQILIGRALWKPRYVIFGTEASLKSHDAASKASTSRKDLRSTSSGPSLVDVKQGERRDMHDMLYVSIYKTKGDWEFVSQHAVSLFQSCEIRNVQHRKQMPSLPTMMLEFKPDTPVERSRKRRSSRTGGLSSKDPWSSTLLFRTVPEERYNIYNWQTTIRPQLTPDSHDYHNELSPISPAFSGFTNPFSKDNLSTKSNRPDFTQRHSSQNINASTYPHFPRDRPSAMISPSPSLRSRRSDLSSEGTSMVPQSTYAVKHYPTLPADLPSPASTSGYDNQFIEGWTSAQGRSSTLSSHHTRASTSIASTVTTNAQTFGTTPPGPRETILDRAFQLRVIPGGRKLPMNEDEKISSIARFEALMRESDDRRQAQQQSVPAVDEDGRSGWSLEEESEESSNDGQDDDHCDSLDLSGHKITMTTPAQRALEYISGRRNSPVTKEPPIPFLNQQALSAFHKIPVPPNNGLRPRTGTGASYRRNSRPTSMTLPSRSSSANAVTQLKDSKTTVGNGGLMATEKDVRRSSSTIAKRLSFTEFAKRLSSTSSLLLVQTNVSSSSGRSRASSELLIDDEKHTHRRSVSLRVAKGTARPDPQDKRCGWRGSVGVFGKEGGFL
ncbi:hypothetical protein BJ878DRAFT_103770 [Calycina marina]|uniref:Uncharacterized protein n=1 Tax=Calycina marina TaxID=1763456 RepID=A0A9P7Z210_9HELO|nr:hypothetical protein BJ878DRAFT_103770 [Calycina marina]